MNSHGILKVECELDLTSVGDSKVTFDCLKVVTSWASDFEIDRIKIDKKNNIRGNLL